MKELNNGVRRLLCDVRSLLLLLGKAPYLGIEQASESTAL